MAFWEEISEMCSLTYRSWYRRRSEGSHASGGAELSKTPLSAWARGVNLPRLSAGLCTRFRVLSFKRKTANFSNAKARCEGASRGIHVAYSLICVFAWALSGASLKT